MKILDFNIEKLPLQSMAFYLGLLEKNILDKPWYSSALVGINSLKTFLPEMFEENSTSVYYLLAGDILEKVYQ